MEKLKPLASLLFFILIFFTLFSSCVSKKKFLSEVERRASCDTTLQQINARNLSLNREIAQLKLQLAEKNGERNAFRELLDKQDGQIDRLEQEIETLTSQSHSQQSSMDDVLREKTRELEKQKALLQSYRDEALSFDEQLQSIVGKLAGEFTDIDGEELGMEIKKGKAHIRLSESLVFRKGSTRLNSGAIDVLEKIGNVLMQYPAMEVMVVGHADNEPGKTSNWDLSTRRATAIVRALTEEIGIPPNQLMAAGKGEFKPLTSNETAEGRAKNRRTEIVVSPPFDQLLKKLKSGN